MSSWQQPRALADGEWPALRTTVNQVFRPGGGDLTQDSPLLFDAANHENLRVIVRDEGPGTPVAHRDLAWAHPGARIVAHAGLLVREALVFQRRIQIACVGGVCTVPDLRGQGLASRVLADVLVRARRGTDLVLCSGDRDLYRRQGLDPVPPLARFRLPSGVTPTAGIGVSDATRDELHALATLYDGEAVHFVRTRDDWQRIWDAGLLVDAPATISIVRRDSSIVAYIATQRATPRADGSMRPRRILEVAGDRAAIVAAAPLVAEELLVPPYDGSTIALCDGKGWIRTARQFLVTADPLTANVLVIPWYGFNYL